MAYDRVELGREAKSALVQGGEVADETYARLVVLAVKYLKVTNDEIAKVDGIAKAKAKTTAKAEEGKPENDDENDDENYDDKEPEEEYMGWVLDDFPNTSQQAVLLEKLLSGYDHSAHVPVPSDRASVLAPCGPDTVASDRNGSNDSNDSNDSEKKSKSKFTPSGISLFVYLSTDPSVTLRRSLGRRLDPVTGAQYHLDTNRPPYDLICKERLVSPEDAGNPKGNLSLSGVAFERGGGSWRRRGLWGRLMGR